MIRHMAVAGLALLATAQTPVERPSVRVIDGDTIVLNTTTVRLWGIDAPEKRQTGGPEATAVLQGLVDAATVTCVPVNLDRYERTIASCNNGTEDLAAAMVEAGWAWDWPEYSDGAFAEKERKARFAGRGLWAQGPKPPWVFRRR